jgi:hypothetical protein
MQNTALPNVSPKDAAETLAATHDRAWIRSVVSYLDQSLQKTPLDRLITLWGLSAAEAAGLFGVSRQAFAKWQQSAPPSDRSLAIATLADATDLLERHLKRERIPVVVRRRAELTGDKSLIELAQQGKYAKVLAAVRAMFDLRRIQP